MGLFSKKKEVEKKIPRLPELPPPKPQPEAFLPKSEIPDVPSGLPQIETQTLPILPESEIGKELNKEAIKHAITKPELPEPKPEPALELQEPGLKPIPSAPIIPSHIKKQLGVKRTLEVPEKALPKIQKLTKKIEPIFIRLDKFQTIVETFEEIKNKIIEIEELLKKTRELKIKEEQELIEWEREIQIIKSRIDLIDKNVFNKLD